MQDTRAGNGQKQQQQTKEDREKEKEHKTNKIFVCMSRKVIG